MAPTTIPAACQLTALDTALSAFPVLFFSIDNQGRILEWSRRASEILGPARDAVIGRAVEDLPIAWDVERVFALAVAAMNSPAEPVSELVRVEREGDKYVVMEFSAAAVAETGGVIVVGEDATTRAFQQESDLHSRKLEAIGQLAAGIAHEINTPMQYISDNTQYVKETLGTLLRPLSCDGADQDQDALQADVVAALEDTLHGIQRVTAIVTAMKAFSHPSSRTPEPVDLNHTVETSIVVTRNEWKYVADMDCDLDPSRPMVLGNSGELHQVLLNLIVNAAHAIQDSPERNRPKGTIRISTRALEDRVELVVADSGCGIPDGIRSRIFDPFFTTKEIGRGTGQGLALVHSIICDRHRGRIDVRSRDAEGTTFRIRFPR